MKKKTILRCGLGRSALREVTCFPKNRRVKIIGSNKTYTGGIQDSLSLFGVVLKLHLIGDDVRQRTHFRWDNLLRYREKVHH